METLFTISSGKKFGEDAINHLTMFNIDARPGISIKVTANGLIEILKDESFRRKCFWSFSLFRVLSRVAGSKYDFFCFRTNVRKVRRESNKKNF